MSGLKRMLASIDRWWRPRCEVAGCYCRDENFGMCGGHSAESWREYQRKEASRKFERDVSVHLEALRRFDEEKAEAAASSLGEDSR